LKRCQAKQTISKRGRQVLPSNIDLIRENQLQALRQRLKDRWLMTARWRRSPRPIIVLVRHSHRHSDDSSLGFGIADQSFDLHPADSSQRCQKRPLVRIRLELLVVKHGPASPAFVKAMQSDSQILLWAKYPDSEKAGHKRRNQSPGDAPSSR